MTKYFKKYYTINYNSGIIYKNVCNYRLFILFIGIIVDIQVNIVLKSRQWDIKLCKIILGGVARMERRKYSAGGVSKSFWFTEFKKVVNLLNDGTSFDEIKRMSIEENFFAAPTQHRSNNIYGTIKNRVNSLDSSFYPLFVSSDGATQKLFNLTAVMATDTLFFDFMYEVVREKMIMGHDELSGSDIRIFFNDKQLQDKTVSTWTDETLGRLGEYYKTILFDAGILDRTREPHTILRPILNTTFEQWLNDHDMGIAVRTLTGVR